MSSIRRLTYSITLSIVISAHSSLFYSQGGEFVAVPGIVLEGFFNVVIVEVTRDTFAGFVIRWMYFNFLFYTASIIFCPGFYNRYSTNEETQHRGILGLPQPDIIATDWIHLGMRNRIPDLRMQ